MKTTAPQLLSQALAIQQERAAQYDQAGGERSAGKVAAMFNIAKGREVVTEADVWLMLTILKIVRGEADGPHADSCLDFVSYSSLYGEARMNQLNQPQEKP